MRKEINNISCVGSGTIGAGWIARLLVNKIKVKVYDLTPFQETRLKIVIENTKVLIKIFFPIKKLILKILNIIMRFLQLLKMPI